MVEPAKDRTARSVVCRANPPKRNVSSHLIIIRSVFCKNSPKVRCIEHDQMISTLPPDQLD